MEMADERRLRTDLHSFFVDDVVDAVTNVPVSVGLDLSDCRGQSYDHANHIMRGIYND